MFECTFDVFERSFELVECICAYLKVMNVIWVN